MELITTNGSLTINKTELRSANTLYTRSKGSGIEYEEYKKVRNLAWQNLIDLGVDRLPVDVFDIAYKCGCVTSPIQGNEEIIRMLPNGEKLLKLHGFSLKIGAHKCIFYSTAVPRTRTRFTIAHEIGHIQMGHAPQGNNAQSETESDSYAARLLTPMAAIHYCRIVCPEELALLSDISLSAATVRWKRYLEIVNRNKFGASPAERALIKRFADFFVQYNADDNCLAAIPDIEIKANCRLSSEQILSVKNAYFKTKYGIERKYEGV